MCSKIFDSSKDVGYTRLPFGTYKIQLPGTIHHIIKYVSQSEFDVLLVKYIRQGLRVCCLDDLSNSKRKIKKEPIQLELVF